MPGRSRTSAAELADDLDVPGALGIAEEAGGSAARAAGSLLGLWYVPPIAGPAGISRAGLCQSLSPDQGVDRGPLALRRPHWPHDLFRAPDG